MEDKQFMKAEHVKQKLIEAINCKFPQNNLMEIYYNIGRVLPFTAQRFPDGRVSDWYRNQYVQVVRIEPKGKYGKYGKAFGFYYRNGVREDAWENDPENSWCKKIDTEPQEIPNSGCGSWVLLEIQGEIEEENNFTKLLGLDDVFTFGKYKGRTIREIVEFDWQYVKWAIVDSQRLLADVDSILEYHRTKIKVLQPEDTLSFGKYKGRAVVDVYNEDSQYLRWLASQNPDFKIDWDKLPIKEDL